MTLVSDGKSDQQVYYNYIDDGEMKKGKGSLSGHLNEAGQNGNGNDKKQESNYYESLHVADHIKEKQLPCSKKSLILIVVILGLAVLVLTILLAVVVTLLLNRPSISKSLPVTEPSGKCLRSIIL